MSVWAVRLGARPELRRAVPLYRLHHSLAAASPTIHPPRRCAYHASLRTHRAPPCRCVPNNPPSSLLRLSRQSENTPRSSLPLRPQPSTLLAAALITPVGEHTSLLLAAASPTIHPPRRCAYHASRRTHLAPPCRCVPNHPPSSPLRLSRQSENTPRSSLPLRPQPSTLLAAALITPVGEHTSRTLHHPPSSPLRLSRQSENTPHVPSTSTVVARCA
ncbi:hypothetical protein DFP72DRAFT_223667 [Ephemerocybe angulata]|uniref:Uncharacterized protein n=1 Tax=Ephemerocybe angulata TaxID=980116 RepID=A0A8H6M7J2_9AGAR|nr:hypothetical protein DFP72DRAFT_223667 [Tulosesus angulatus]